MAHGDRFSGSDELAAAAAWCTEELGRAGLETRRQPYRFPRFEVGETRAELVSPGEAPRELPAYPVFYAASTGGTLEGPVRRRGDDLTGAFLASQESRIGEDFQLALEEHALGVVVSTDRRPLYSGDGLFATGISPRWSPLPVPAAVVDGLGQATGSESLLRLRSTHRIAEGEGRNVVGLLPGTGDGWVLLTAHLDSWFRGAVDDGTGVAVALASAHRLARVGPHRRGLVVLLADGEELGLLGSSVFLRRSEELGIPLDRIDALVELDMVTSLGAYGGGPPSSSEPFPRFLVTTPGLETEARLLDEALGSRDLVVPVGLAEVLVGIRTDARWFFHRGVPGVFVNVLTPNYHTPLDTLEWVDPLDLAQAVDGTVAALEALLERDALPVTPHLPLDLQLRREGARLAMEVTAPDGDGPAELEVLLRIHSDLGRLASVPAEPDGTTGPRRYHAEVEVDGDLPLEVLATATAGSLAGDVWRDLPGPGRIEPQPE